MLTDRTAPSPPAGWMGGRARTTASAPGRVNLIGEHTDYNGGFVLPMTIPQETHVQMVMRDDRTVHARSANLGGIYEYMLGGERPTGQWIDYVQGITSVVESDGHRLRGFDLHIASDVPVGSGLSSSAALEVSLLRALQSAFALPLDPLAIARLAHRAETGFVGAPVGVMDQMVCSLGDRGSALFLDVRSMHVERVPLPKGIELAVIDSGIRHAHASGDYRLRRAECERACGVLGIGSLRDLSAADLGRASRLPEPLLRRVRHVVTENDRVLQAVDAMRAGDAQRLGLLLYGSHESMRDDYQVSVPEIDLLVELARGHSATFGARLTGGGFGGSIIVLISSGHARVVADAVVRAYHQKTGQQARVLVPSS